MSSSICQGAYRPVVGAPRLAYLVLFFLLWLVFGARLARTQPPEETARVVPSRLGETSSGVSDFGGDDRATLEMSS